jgi:hypothetical protein
MSQQPVIKDLVQCEVDHSNLRPHDSLEMPCQNQPASQSHRQDREEIAVRRVSGERIAVDLGPTGDDRRLTLARQRRSEDLATLVALLFHRRMNGRRVSS